MSVEVGSDWGIAYWGELLVGIEERDRVRKVGPGSAKEGEGVVRAQSGSDAD